MLVPPAHRPDDDHEPDQRGDAEENPAPDSGLGGHHDEQETPRTTATIGTAMNSRDLIDAAI